MDRHRWDPQCERPDTLVAPRRIDPTGVSGPTRRQAQGPRFRRTGPGLYVPSEVDASVVEQRIFEQAHRMRRWGAVTGWASLRWRGGTFFDGTADGGRTQRPVPLVVGLARIREDPLVRISQEQLAPHDREEVAGVWCTTVARALFDEVRATGWVREGVVRIDMAAAAGLIDVATFAAYVSHKQAWTGVPLVRASLPLADDHSRSPQETRLRLCWVLDADLPAPLCNQPVYDRAGRLLGIADLLDPVAGVVGEYDGEDHRSADRHRRDVRREEQFRDHGLEYFTVVGGELRDRQAVAQRMVRVRSRARFLPPDQRLWVLDRAA